MLRAPERTAKLDSINKSGKCHNYKAKEEDPKRHAKESLGSRILLDLRTIC